MLQIHHQYDLSHANTMALTSVATTALVLTDETDIVPAITYLKNNDLSPFVLSGGSNVILPSQVSACVLLPKFTGITVLSETDKMVTIAVQAGEHWHTFVRTCLDKGWYGLENLALIPGLVGACPVQNIGAYGVQVSDFIDKVLAYDLTDGTRHTFDLPACQFDYRHSFFKDNPNRYLIAQVVFTLHKNPSKINAQYGDLAQVAQDFAIQNGRTTPTPHDVFDAVVHIRKAKLPNPATLPNCGSFFQNPIITKSDYGTLKTKFSDLPCYPVDEKCVKIPAGWLIDKAGLKGGGVAPILTHKNQALVLTNHAPHKASQDDILASQALIVDTVLDKFGVRLVREPVWID